MVLQQRGLLVPETGGDVPTLLLGEDDAVELAVDDVVVVEGARVLGDAIEFATEGAEGAAVDAVGMGGTEDVWSCTVDGVVYHVGGRVSEAVFAAVDDFAGGVHLDQVAGFDHGEGKAEWVDPECRRVNRVTEGDVPGNAFVIPEFAEDAEREGESAFEVFAFLVVVCEGGRGGKVHHLGAGDLGGDFGFMRGGGGGLGSWAIKALWGNGPWESGAGFGQGRGRRCHDEKVSRLTGWFDRDGAGLKERCRDTSRKTVLREYA